MSWPIVKLGEIFEIARGGSPRPIDDYFTDEEDGLNWVSIKDASDSEKYIYSTQKKIKPSGLVKTREVKPGDFLLTNSMSFGRPYIMKTHGCIHDGWLLLRGNPNQVDQDYFYHLLGSDLIFKKFSSLAAGAVVKNLNSDLVRNVEVSIPPLEEQKRIAAILDKADAIRRKRQQAIKLADDFLRSVFLEMFGDPVSQGWDFVTIGEMASANKGSIRTGPFGSDLKHSEFTEEGVAVLGIDNAVKNKFSWDKERFISQKKYQELKRYTVRPGDVLITIMGTCGRCAVVPDDIPLAINTKHLCCITLDTKKCLPDFLHSYYLYHPIAAKYLNKMTKGAIMDGLNLGIIKEMPIPVVPIKKQNDFYKIKMLVESVSKKMSEGNNSLLFSSLQHRAFLGELAK